MSKSLIWVGAFLGVFLILFVLQTITSEKPSHPGNMPMMQEPNSTGGNSQGAQDGRSLTASMGCITCHGTELQGTNLAPRLTGLKENFDRDKLVNYLRNPQSFMDGDRYKAFREKYKNIVMPSFNNRDVKELGILADYLLSLQ